ncbi:hypothetical protein HDV01_003319 [Terramyces sp. JEL0728]|nr:hypothetical protein HDV01_003319 [Terramyces sp. JEL0728]
MALTVYIILRKDLLKMAGWSQGSMIGQACHGVSKMLWEKRNDEAVIRYMEDMDNMHKVVLELKNASQLETLSTSLQENKIDFVRWVEMPENTLSCLVTKPYEPDDIRPLLKKCSLFK